MSTVRLALDLLVDVQWLLSLADAAFVAGDDELAHLLDQLTVDSASSRRPLVEQLPQLDLDVEWRFAASLLAVGLRLQHLPDLGLAGLPGGRRGAVRDPRRQVAVELDREWALPDLLERVPGPEHEGDQRDRDRHQDDDEDHLSGAEAERDGEHPPRVRATGRRRNTSCLGTRWGTPEIPVSFPSYAG
jgi:hypothetical protein